MVAEGTYEKVPVVTTVVDTRIPRYEEQYAVAAACCLTAITSLLTAEQKGLARRTCFWDTGPATAVAKSGRTRSVCMLTS